MGYFRLAAQVDHASKTLSFGIVGWQPIAALAPNSNLQFLTIE